MSAERVARIQRVLEARKAVADKVEIDLAELANVTARAEEAMLDARSSWYAAMNRTLQDHCTGGDLADVHGYAASLGRAYEGCVRAVRVATEQRESCRRRLCVARTEVRKLELWCERVLEESTRDAAGSERRAADDLAARTRVVRTA